MHAVVIDVTIDDRAAARAELEQLVPQVSAAPGFVAAYWVALPDGTGSSIAVFDSEASAQALVAMTEGAPAMSVTLQRVAVGEVIAHA
jgi:quinol monooxygenase YgiN